MHPAIAAALTRLRDGEDVAAAVEASGYSHRGLVALFRHAIGLSPKLWSRVAALPRREYVAMVTAGAPNHVPASLGSETRVRRRR